MIVIIVNVKLDASYNTFLNNINYFQRGRLKLLNYMIFNVFFIINNQITLHPLFV